MHTFYELQSWIQLLKVTSIHTDYLSTVAAGFFMIQGPSVANNLGNRCSSKSPNSANMSKLTC